MLKEYIKKLMRKENLNTSEIENALEDIISSGNEAQIAAFLVLLTAKGST